MSIKIFFARILISFAQFAVKMKLENIMPNKEKSVWKNAILTSKNKKVVVMKASGSGLLRAQNHQLVLNNKNDYC